MGTPCNHWVTGLVSNTTGFCPYCEIERLNKELGVQTYAADNYRRLLYEGDQAYSERLLDIEKLKAENEKLSDLWSQMRDERNALRNADVDREKYCKRLEADVALFEPYLKEDETPFQRLKREIKDGHALMTVYGHALAEIEKLKELK